MTQASSDGVSIFSQIIEELMNIHNCLEYFMQGSEMKIEQKSNMSF